MPVTQWIRGFNADGAGGGIGGASGDLVSTTAAGNSGVVVLGTAATSKVYINTFANGQDDATANDQANKLIPNSRITGIEIRIGCIIRGDGGGALLDNNTTNEVEFSIVRYANDIFDVTSPASTDFTPEVDAIQHIATKTATDLAANYDGSGTTNDPRNYPLILGGEGNLLTLPQLTAASYFHISSRWGIEIKRGQGQSTYEVAVGGDSFGNNNPMPAVRYYYEYPKVYINTGKIKLTSGKIKITNYS